MQKVILNTMDKLVNGKKKNIFSYLLYAVMLIILGVAVTGKVIFNSLKIKKQRLK